jgi:hypothetical protein
MDSIYVSIIFICQICIYASLLLFNGLDLTFCKYYLR